MKEEYKKLWVEALRSGKYRQVQRQLNNGLGMCCLGVLCDIVDPNEWEEGSNGSRAYYDHEFLPPPRVCELTGLPVAGIYNKDSNITNQLTNMNDNGATFAEIADFIEEYL